MNDRKLGELPHCNPGVTQRRLNAGLEVSGRLMQPVRRNDAPDPGLDVARCYRII